MDVNLAELIEKVNDKISTLDDEKAQIQSRIKDIDNEKTAMQKHFEAIDAVSALAEKFDMEKDKFAMEKDEFAMEEMDPAESGDGVESDPGDRVESEVLASDSDAEGESDISEMGGARKGDVLSYLKEQLDAEEADDASQARDDDALSFRA